MNKLLVTLTACLLFSLCSMHKTEVSNLEVKVNIGNKLNYNYWGGYYSISVDLINNTDSVVRFWAMTCSWEDNWITNNPSLHLAPSACDRNFPKIKQIMPGQKMTFNSEIQILDSVKIIGSNDLRLGFILVKEKDETYPAFDFHEILKEKAKETNNIIWSSPFKIGK